MTIVHRHAHLTVNPLGVLYIDIVEEHRKLKANFEDLLFESNGKTTGLVCIKHGKSKHKRWHVDLSSNDAKELTTLINSAREEYETLMRDL
ncbi:hypothetical protein C9J12_10495 [Photobacterium frigidiphilum]|uniref:Uncharacterized protein n=2 Tax=Photobacterium frigidiphilum TaxID=264736 RepID=A0A2T3JJ56_9GAMM|nr:hypothetical protein [Photobacterium frigidiphilum]PSU48919.1 hypothetical protein C9J12_10495 [Photobacterium frigidiphilum]